MGRDYRKRRKKKKEKRNLTFSKERFRKISPEPLSTKAIDGFKYAIGKTLAGNIIKRKPKYI